MMRKCKRCKGSLLYYMVDDHEERYEGFKCVLCAREFNVKNLLRVDKINTLTYRLSTNKIKRIKVLLHKGRNKNIIAAKFNIPLWLVADISNNLIYKGVKIIIAK